MKRTAYVLILGLIAGSAAVASFGMALAIPPEAIPTSGQAADPLIAKALDFVKAMSKGDFVLAVKDFDETMMKLSGPDKLAPFWKEQLPGQVGAFIKQTAARRDKLGSYDIVLVTCDFEKATLDIRVVFGTAGKISGFQVVPSVPPASYAPPAYADPSKFEEKDVTVGAAGWPLPGTLTMPNGGGPFPAVVLVHGSGPNDRDESIGPNKPFKDLAWGLAGRGIAVLRYDKRSKVYGAKIASDPKLFGALTVNEETIDDAGAAVALLKKTDKIDHKRIFVLGHSLGGYLMPRIAWSMNSLGIDGYIIMAGLTRPLDDTILRQMRYLLGGAPTEDAKKKLAEVEAEIAKIKALTESDRNSGAKFFNAAPAYWLDLRGYDPVKVAESVKRPMLILQGSRDYQVTTDDFDNWKKGLGSRADVEFHLYPKLNHLFFEGQGPATPDEYMQIHGSVAPYVVNDIAVWILKH